MTPFICKTDPKTPLLNYSSERGLRKGSAISGDVTSDFLGKGIWITDISKRIITEIKNGKMIRKTHRLWPWDGPEEATGTPTHPPHAGP